MGSAATPPKLDVVPVANDRKDCNLFGGHSFMYLHNVFYCPHVQKTG